MALTDRNLEFVLRMNTDQFVRATTQAQQQFAQSLSGLTGAATAESSRLNAAISGMANIATLRELRQQLAGTSQEVRAAQTTVHTLTEEIARSPAVTAAMTNALRAAESEATRLEAAYLASREAVRQTAASMTAAGINVRALNAEEERLRTTIGQSFANLQEHARAQAQLRQGMAELNGEMRSTASSVNGLASSFAQATALAYSLHKTVGGSLTLFASFDDMMRRVKVATDATGEEYAQLIALAEKMGAETRFTAREAAGALNVLATAGLKAQEAMTALPSTLELAAAAAMGLEETATITMNIMNGFGFTARNLTGINDVLIRVANDTDSSVTLMGHAFSYVAPVAKAAGSDFRDVAAALGVLHDAGIKGERAGTALRSILTTLLKPTQEQQDALDHLGISVSAVDGKIINLIEIFQRFASLGPSHNREILKIFGDDGGTGFLAILNRGIPALEKLRTNIDAAGGSAKSAAREMEGGLGGAFRNLSSATEGLGIRLGKDLAPAVKAVADAMAILITFFTNLTTPTRIYAELVAGLGLAYVAWTRAIGPLVAALGTYTAATAAATAATVRLNIATKAGVWGLVIGGIATGIYEAVTALKEWLETSKKATQQAQTFEAFQNNYAKTLREITPPKPAPVVTPYKPGEGPDLFPNPNNPDDTPAAKSQISDLAAAVNTEQERLARSFAAMRAELEKVHDSSKQLLKDTTKDDIAFWEAKLKLTGLEREDKVQVEHALVELHRKAAQEKLAITLSTIKAEAAKELEGSQARVDAAKREADEIGKAYGTGDQKFIEAMQAVTVAEREHQAKLREFAGLRVKAEKDAADAIANLEMETLRFRQETEIVSIQEVMEARLRHENQMYQNTMVALHAELGIARAGSVEQEKIRNDIAQATRTHSAELLRIKTEYIAQQKEIELSHLREEKDSEDARIASRMQTLQYMQGMELMTAREVMLAKKDLDQESFDVSMALMREELKRKTSGTFEFLQLQAAIRRETLGHNLAIQKSNQDLAVQAKHDFDAMIAPIRSSLSNSLSGLITHTTTVKQAVGNMEKAILDQLTSYATKELFLWGEKELAKTALGKSFGLARIADQAAESTAKAGIKTGEGATFQTVEGLKMSTTLTGSASRIAGQASESTAINIAKASEGEVAVATEGVKAGAAMTGLGAQAAADTKSIGMSAWTGMANAYASISAIPMVGPFLAPAVAAGVFASIILLAKNLFSAKGGFDIPAGINPVTQLHEKEMVLPAEHADTIRSLKTRKGGGGDVFNVYVSAMDAKGFESYLYDNAHTMTPALRKLARSAAR